MTIYRLGDLTPSIQGTAYIAPEATIIGQVTIGEHSSVWAHAVLRGDNEPIAIGDCCNVQEGSVLHTDPDFPLVLADYVTVGHQAMLHGCRVGEGSLIGIQAAMLNGAEIGRHCLVGAGSLITQGKSFPDCSLILGRPAQVVRTLSDEEVARLRQTAEKYARRAAHYREHLERID